MASRESAPSPLPMQREVRRVAVVGAGVIGAGWVARFLSNGLQVRLYDPSPESQALVEHTCAQAERSLARLLSAPLPRRGALRICSRLEDSLSAVDWVQESVPEREDLKRSVLADIEAAVDCAVPIGSSTSGLLPSRLQAGLQHPERFFVAHPFNPVYLLPLVELVGGVHTSPEVVSRAAKFYESLGMKALIVRKEIDAFLADRLLEAVWREALWLIEEEVATTQEIDDSIRFGFGLRWAQMGLFETYRIAGGKIGMRHFLEQFAPTLQLPWSKLTAVPPWTDKLKQRILAQCEAQGRQHSVEALERIRDDNLVGILSALRSEGWGAGKVLLDYERTLFARSAADVARAKEEREGEAEKAEKEGEVDSPSSLLPTLVRPLEQAWLDYNGHMTESRYLQVFSEASDALLSRIGLDEAYFARGFSFYTRETHLRHLQEGKIGQDLEVATRVLFYDDKRLHILHEMRARAQGQEQGQDKDEEPPLLASAEQMLLHVDRNAARSVPIRSPLKENLARLYNLHRTLERPPYAGRLWNKP